MKLTDQENFILTIHNSYFTNLPDDRNIAEEGIPRLDECIGIMKQHEVLVRAMYPYQLEKIKDAVVSNRENSAVVKSLFQIIPGVLSSVHFLMILNATVHDLGKKFQLISPVILPHRDSNDSFVSKSA